MMFARVPFTEAPPGAGIPFDMFLDYCHDAGSPPGWGPVTRTEGDRTVTIAWQVWTTIGTETICRRAVTLDLAALQVLAALRSDPDDQEKAA